MVTQNRKRTLLQIQVGLPYQILLSMLLMSVLIALVFFCKIPNPNMILIAGLVLCSAIFGYGGGITAGVVMFFYTLYFFSTDNDFITFSDVNRQKVFVSLVGIVADMLFVCTLKHAELAAHREVDQLSNELQKENEHLQNISLLDGLTGLKNRMALRKDYPGYFHRRVTVMMVDMDNFKHINDTLGHEEGDRVLKQTAEMLAREFGQEHCYRYGGDEFLVIVPEITCEDFKRKLEAVQSGLPLVEFDGVKEPAGFSAGCTNAVVSENYTLREMFSAADEKMYEAKWSKRK